MRHFWAECCSRPLFEQHLDNLRRKDSLRGAETTEISVRPGNYSASHSEGPALGLIALVWLCLLLQWTWTSDSAAVCPTPPELSSPVPKRHPEPTPFAGPPTKPHCDACAYSTDPRPQPPSAPPPRIVPTRGRRRQVDLSMHFCPNPCSGQKGR